MHAAFVHGIHPPPIAGKALFWSGGGEGFRSHHVFLCAAPRPLAVARAPRIFSKRDLYPFDLYDFPTQQEVCFSSFFFEF